MYVTLITAPGIVATKAGQSPAYHPASMTGRTYRVDERVLQDIAQE
jgi:hypothetical protein